MSREPVIWRRLKKSGTLRLENRRGMGKGSCLQTSGKLPWERRWGWRGPVLCGSSEGRMGLHVGSDEHSLLGVRKTILTARAPRKSGCGMELSTG